MKNKIKLLLLLLSILFVFYGCDGAGVDIGNLTTPVYRGMTITQEINQTTSYEQSETTDEIDDTFVDDIEDAFGVITTDEVEYYVLPNSTLYININVYNPDQFEILSFSLNGKKYQSYEFEDGSNSELLILEVQIDDLPGIREYTIDGIKYIDGTVINDVIMDGNQTVKVGVEHTTLPFSSVENLTIHATSMTLDVKVTDYDDLILNTTQKAKFFIYDGLSIVYEQDLEIGANTLSISNLMFNQHYQYAIAAPYDKVDGQGVGIYVLESNEFQTLPLFEFQENLIDQTSFDLSIVDFDINDTYQITSIELYDGDTLVETSQSLTEIAFADLYSGYPYQVKVNYSYNLGQGDVLDVYTYDIQTVPKALPTLEYVDLVQTQTSLAFDFNIIDVDQIASIKSLDLFLDDVLVESKTLNDTFEFTELFSGTAYEIRVYYDYDLNNGEGVQSSYISSTLETIAKTIPTLELTSVEALYDRIAFDYTITDVDQVGYIKEIYALDEENTKIALTDLTQKEIINLIADNLYTLNILYAYDLNDNHGEQQITITEEVYTKPYLSVISTNIINTERLTEGDMIYLEIEVDNPSDIDFEEVVINGQTYSVSNVTTQHSIYVEFMVDASYTGGETAFVVEEINGYKHGILRSFAAGENNVGYAFINGDILVKDMLVVDQHGNVLDKVMPGDIFYVNIYFDNPTGYDITEIFISNYQYSDQGTQVPFKLNEDKTVVSIQQTAFYRNQLLNYYIDSFTYGDDVFGYKTKDTDGVSTFVISVTNYEYQMIYTAEDLMNIQNGYAYRLANDIDLTGIIWEPKDISYVVFDGAGFAIKNLSIVKSITDSNVNLGLFRNVSYSTIKNLTLENFLIMVDMQREQTSNNYNSYIGMLSSYIYTSKISNINVYGELSIIASLGYDNQLGGITGTSQNSEFTQIYVNANLSSNAGRVGGIVGYSNDSKITRSLTEGKIFGKYETAGIVGMGYNTIISDVYSNATITVEENGAGLIGGGHGVYIKNSYFNGVVTYTNDWGNVFGIINWGSQITLENVFSLGLDKNGQPLIATQSTYDENKLINVYALVSYDENFIKQATQAEIETIFKDLWDLNIWAFTDQGVVLKWTPSIRFTNIIEGENFIAYDYETTDFDGVGHIESIAIYKDDLLVNSTTDLNSDRFEGLRHNTNYLLVITYVYDYGDELGVQSIEITKEVKTLPATGTPVVEDLVFAITDTSFDFTYTLNDPNEIGVFESIKLYDENQTLVAELTSLDDLSFTGLLSNHLYRVEIIYSYVLDAQYGEEYSIEKAYVRTNPQVSFTEVEVLNTDDLFTGDLVVLELTIDNPDLIEFTEAVINGETFEVVSSSINRVRIDITLLESFGYGATQLNIDSITGKFMGETYVYTFNQTLFDSIYINGILSIEAVQILDINDQEVEYVTQGNTIKVKLSLDNVTKYDIDSIVIRIQGDYWDERTIDTFDLALDYQSLTFNLNVNQRITYIEILNITYSSEQLSSKEQNLAGVDQSLIVLLDDNIRYIDSPEDLQNIESGYAYEIISDIDLSGFNFAPIDDFYGYINGNGHMISDLTMIKSYDDQYIHIGLFKNIRNAIVKNMMISNVNFIITQNSTANDHYYGYIGILAGQISQYSIISNITISGSIDANYNGNGEQITGLLAGRIENTTLDMVMVTGTLRGNKIFGGLTGDLSRSLVTNTYTNVDLDVQSYDNGNFAGRISDSIIRYSYASGTVINTVNSWDISGFAGYTYGSILDNVFTFTKDADGAYIRGLRWYQNTTTNHVYGVAAGDLFVQNSLENIINHAKENWDPAIWSFTKELPLIKQIPIISAKVDVKSTSSLSFDLNIFDFDQVGYIKSIALYQKGVLIEELTEFNNIYFDELRYSTKYELRVVYGYDYQDGYGEQLIDVSVFAYTADKNNVPQVTFKDVVVDQTSVTFDYDIIDPLNIGTFISIELYDINGTLIETLNGQTYAFNELDANTTYYIQVNYTYEFTDDTWGPNELEAIYEFQTLAYETPTISLSNNNNTYNSISFTLDINDPYQLGVITAARLYEDYDQLVDSLDTFNQLVFEDLYSSHWYRVVIEYTYDLNDQQGQRVLYRSFDFWTNSINEPYYYPTETSSTEHSLSFDYHEDDPEELSELIAIELYDGLNLVERLEDLTLIHFDNLLSNHQYNIRFVYLFDRNDGQGVIEAYRQHSLNTNAYQTPTIDFSQIEVTQNQMNYEASFNLNASLGSITHMGIYLDDVLITETETNTISFNALASDTVYQLVVTYSYNLLDGKGVIEKTATYEFNTAPYASVTGVSILNNQAVIVGDSLSINIDLDNPSEVLFTHVVINGIKYSVTSYTVSKLRVDISVTEDLGLLGTDLVVSKLIGELDNQIYTYLITENNVANTYINADIYVESIEFYDSENQPITYGVYGQQVRVVVTFYNPSNYEITYLTLRRGSYNSTNYNTYNDLTLLNNQFTFTTTIQQPYQFFVEIEQIEYSNDLVSTRTKQLNEKQQMIVLNDLEIVEIRTPEDLLNMESGYHYKLMNDIDLSETLWTPIDNFRGVFDGNGYTISNLTYIQTYQDQSIETGMFKQIRYSEIKDLTLENIIVLITLKTGSNDSYSMNVGGLAGTIEYSNLENVKVNGQVDLNNQTYQYGNYAGMIAGIIRNSELSMISVEGFVKSTGEVAGISSRFEYSSLSYAIAHIDLQSDLNYNIAGIVVDAYYSTLEYVYATGRIYGEHYYNYYGIANRLDRSTMTNSFSYMTDMNSNVLRSFSYTTYSKFDNVYTPVYDGYAKQSPIVDTLSLMKTLWGNEAFVYVNNYPEFKIEPKIALQNFVTDDGSTSFDLYTHDPHDISSLISISIYKDDVLIETLTNLNDLTFVGLRYGSSYIVELVYSYNYLDGTGEQLKTINYRVRTLDKENAPTIDITDVVVGQEDVSFDYVLMDTLGITQSILYRLLDENYEVIMTSDSLTSFTGLLSDTAYILEVIAVYDYNDGFGPNEQSTVYDFVTLAKQTPEISFVNVSSTSNSVTFDFNIDDIDATGEITGINLIQNNVIIQTLNDLNIRTFEGLNDYETYQLEVIYQYNLNDGSGLKTVTNTYQIKTTPLVELTQTQLMNSGSIVQGDTISLKLFLNNPSGLSFDEVKINGIIYSITELSATELLVEYAALEGYEGGLTDLVVTNLYATYNQESFNITTNANNTAQILINGDIYVESIDVKQNGTSIDYAYQNEVITVEVSFYNPTMYDIDSIYISLGSGAQTFDSTQFTLNADHTVLTLTYTAAIGDYVDSIFVYSFNYSNASMESRMRQSAAEQKTIILVDLEAPIEITTAEELQAITSGNNYKLMNDIDLTGFDWEPIDYGNGLFDGQGFTISNLNSVKTYEDMTPYVGLFRQINGVVINNLTLDNINISVTNRSYLNNNYYIFLGGLAAYASSSVIDNVSVNGTLSANSDMDAGSNVGGLIGSANSNTVIKNITIDIIINSNTQYWNNYTGGLVGRIEYSKVERVNVDASINGYRYLGGLFGDMYQSYLNIAQVNIDLKGDEYIAGIAYQINQSTISNVYVYGQIEANNNWSQGSLARYVYNSTIMYAITDVEYLTHAYSSYIYSSSNSEISYGYSLDNYSSIYVSAMTNMDNTSVVEVYSLSTNSYEMKETFGQNVSWMQNHLAPFFDPTIWDFYTLDELGNPTLIV